MLNSLVVRLPGPDAFFGFIFFNCPESLSVFIFTDVNIKTVLKTVKLY